MNTLRVTILIGILILSQGEKTGIKSSINQQTVTEGVRFYSGRIFSLLTEIQIADMNYNFKAGKTNLSVSVTNIRMHVTQIPAERFVVQFQEPKTIIVKTDEIKGNGGFNAKLKISIISDTLSTVIDIKNLILQAYIDMGWEPSKSVPNKYIPAIKVTRLDVDIDFDFDIQSTIIGQLFNVVKAKIKEEIKRIAVAKIQEKLIDGLPRVFSEIMNAVPLQPNISPLSDICIDYSLVAEPYVKNGHLFLSSYAKIMNPKIEKTINPPFELVDIGNEIGVLGKNVEHFISTYVINTGIYTFTLSDKINLTITDKDLPSQSPFRLKTYSLNLIFPGLADKYGWNKEMTLNFKAVEPVDGAKLSNDYFEIEINIEISFFVEDVASPAIVFNSKIQSVIKLEVKPSFDVEISIVSLILKSLLVKQSNLPTSVNPESAKNFINYTLNILIPIANRTILSLVKFYIPALAGISFKDSALKINTNYIEYGLTPIFVPPQ